MTDPFSMRNIDNQKSNVTFVPAVNQAEGFAEARKTQQFGKHPSAAQYNMLQDPSNQMLENSELNNISESNLVSESLPAVVQNQKTGENITNLQINVSFKPDDSHLPHISNKNQTFKQRTNNRQSVNSQLSLDLVEEANLEPKPSKFDMEGNEENVS